MVVRIADVWLSARVENVLLNILTASTPSFDDKIAKSIRFSMMGSELPIYTERYKARDFDIRLFKRVSERLMLATPNFGRKSLNELKGLLSGFSTPPMPPLCAGQVRLKQGDHHDKGKIRVDLIEQKLREGV